MAPRWILSAALALSAVSAMDARAQTFPPITDRDYSLDVFQGVVLGGTRVVGLGGAYVAIAEGTEGVGTNPAAAVNWPYYSNDPFDWTFHLDLLVSRGIGGQDLDFDNNGRRAPTESTLVTGGAGLSYYRIGLALTFAV